MENKWEGPCKPSLFHQIFLQVEDSDIQPEWLKGFETFDASKYSTERDMNKAFVKHYETLRVKYPGIFGDMKMVFGDRVDKSAASDFRADAMVYEDGVNTASREDSVQYQFGQIPIEFKLKIRHDPFEDNKWQQQRKEKKKGQEKQTKKRSEKPFLKAGENATETRSQLATYTALIDNHQYRKHIFQLLICGNTARFLRWDHAGTVVSESFNYREQSDLLVTFLHRFSRLNEAERGLDTRFTRVSLGSEDDKLAREKLEGDWEHPRDKRQVVQFLVTDDDGKSHELLAWKHAVARLSTVGRATRAFPVWNKTMGAKMFYKDGWHTETLVPESEIVRKLHLAGVLNIPTIIAGGTILDLSTFNDQFAEMLWNKADSSLTSVVRRVYRFVLIQEVGRPLSTFTSTKELLKATLDAFLAHQDAYVLCDCLHRDISDLNILIVDAEEGPKGLLIDWEMSKEISEINDGGKQPQRTGTWQFMSGLLNKFPEKRHQLQDDLESFLHVLMYTAFRYLNTDSKPDRLEKFMDELYNATGNLKKSFFDSPAYVFEKSVIFVDSPTITTFIAKACVYASEWLACPASLVARGDGDGIIKFTHSKAVIGPEIRFRNHDALVELWEEHLEDDKLLKEKPIITPFDYLLDRPRKPWLPERLTDDEYLGADQACDEASSEDGDEEGAVEEKEVDNKSSSSEQDDSDNETFIPPKRGPRISWQSSTRPKRART